MDTLNLIEKILFVFTDNIWIFYLAVCLRQQVRMKAVSVREMTFLALLDKATSYVVLALMSVLGFFLAMRSGGGDRRLLLIAVDMLFVMGLMWLIKFRAILSYNFVLGKILEFAVVSADKNHIFYLLVDENERVIWEETTSDQRVIDYLEASPGDHFFVKVKQLKLGDPSPFVIEFLDEEAFKRELERRRNHEEVPGFSGSRLFVLKVLEIYKRKLYESSCLQTPLEVCGGFFNLIKEFEE